VSLRFASQLYAKRSAKISPEGIDMLNRQRMQGQISSNPRNDKEIPLDQRLRVFRPGAGEPPAR
jgi:hypothetical protein